MTNGVPSCLSDPELLGEVSRLARCEREATVELIAHLAELDARRLYLGAGFPSLFAYCTEVLRLSEHGTYNRIEAARTARKFPVVLEMLSDGSLNLATVRLLAPHLTDDNHRELLESASGRSKREVEVLLSRYFPQPPVPTLVRKLPVRRTPAALPLAASPAVTVAAPPPSQRHDAVPQPSFDPVPACPASSQPSRRPTATPLSPERHQIRFTASAETYQKLRKAQELLGHAVPDRDVAAIFDRALTVLLGELRRSMLAATDRPRAGRATARGSRHIPAEVRRAVWRRDGGRCAFVAKDGRRCAAGKRLEFHHIRPYGVGGEATIRNIELRCAAHNRYEADLFYGAATTGRGRESAGTGRSDGGLFVRGRTRPGASSPAGDTHRRHDMHSAGSDDAHSWRSEIIGSTCDAFSEPVRSRPAAPRLGEWPRQAPAREGRWASCRRETTR